RSVRMHRRDRIYEALEEAGFERGHMTPEEMRHVFRLSGEPDETWEKWTEEQKANYRNYLREAYEDLASMDGPPEDPAAAENDFLKGLRAEISDLRNIADPNSRNMIREHIAWMRDTAVEKGIITR